MSRPGGTAARPRNLFVVAGTGTEVGKTWVACSLARELRGWGLSVAARKLAQSFDLPGPPSPGPAFAQPAFAQPAFAQPAFAQPAFAQPAFAQPAFAQPAFAQPAFAQPASTQAVPAQRISAEPTDADLLAAATGERPTDVCPPHRWYPKAMAPPMAAESMGLPGFTVADLVGEISWPDGAEVGLVELAGGTGSPQATDGDGIDVVTALRPGRVILVAGAGLGTLSDVRLTAVALGAWPLVVYLNRYDPADGVHAANLCWLTERRGLAVATSPTDLAALLF